MPGGIISSFKIGGRDRLPHAVRQMADQQFIDQVNGPEDIMDQQVQKGMIVIPTDHDRIETQDQVEDAFFPVFHLICIYRKIPFIVVIFRAFYGIIRYC